MSIGDLALVVTAVVAVASAVIVTVKWSVEPRLTLAIRDTMAPQAEQVDAISRDLAHLVGESQQQAENDRRIEEKVDTLSTQFSDIAQRTAALEGAERERNRRSSSRATRRKTA